MGLVIQILLDGIWQNKAITMPDRWQHDLELYGKAANSFAHRVINTKENTIIKVQKATRITQ